LDLEFVKNDDILDVSDLERPFVHYCKCDFRFFVLPKYAIDSEQLRQVTFLVFVITPLESTLKPNIFHTPLRAPANNTSL
jgi:hypothetical protein